MELFLDLKNGHTINSLHGCKIVRNCDRVHINLSVGVAIKHTVMKINIVSSKQFTKGRLEHTLLPFLCYTYVDFALKMRLFGCEFGIVGYCVILLCKTNQYE